MNKKTYNLKKKYIFPNCVQNFVRLICRNGEWRVNAMAAALCFPEIFSCGRLHLCSTIQPVLLPDHTLQEVQQRLTSLLTASRSLASSSVVEVKLESDHDEVDEDVDEEEEEEMATVSDECEPEVVTKESPVRKTRRRCGKIWRHFTEISTTGVSVRIGRVRRTGISRWIGRRGEGGDIF